jgi:hypothetical protein
MARATWRNSFERDKDFVVFRRPLTISGATFVAGDPFDKTLVPTRKLRQLFEGHRIIFADAGKPGALPETPVAHEGNGSDTLIGSDAFASTYEIAGETVSLGALVAAAHVLSEKTVEEWNALPVDDRDALIRLQLDRLLAQVPGDDAPENPDAEQPGNDDTQTGAPDDGTAGAPEAISDEVAGDQPDEAGTSEAGTENEGGHPLDHDGDGEPGGSQPAADRGEDIAKLRADATELGVKIDMRWGAKRLQAAIDEALKG